MKILLKTASMIFLLAGVFRPVPAPASGVNFNDTSNIALAQVSNNVGIGTTTPQGGFVVTNGNVGIGTWAPIQLLDVKGTTRVANFIMSGQSPSNGYVLSATDSLGDTTWIPSTVGGGWTVVGSNTYLTTPSNNVGVGTTTPQGAFVVTNGNVGIGTWVPTAALAVGANALTVSAAGAITASTGIVTSGSYTQSGTSANTFTGTPTFSNGTYSAFFTGGNVGLGTTTPQTALAVTNGNVGIGTWTAAGGNLIVNGGGNVGIGSAWPGQTLDVNGRTRTLNFTMTNQSPSPGYVLTASDSAGDATWTVTTGVGNWTKTGNDIYNSNSGNVGIGSTVPTAALNVVAPAQALININNSSGSNLSGLKFQENGTTKFGFFVGNTSINDLEAYDYTASATRLLIDSNGNVGIGTTLVKANLDVIGATAGNVFIVRDAVSGNSALVVKPKAAGSGVEIQGIQGQVGGTADLSLNPEGSNVGIGSTVPNVKLDIVGGVKISNGNTYQSYTQGGTNGLYLGMGSDIVFTGAGNNVVLSNVSANALLLGTSNTERMRIDSAGNVGIGITSPTSLVAINAPIGTIGLKSALSLMLHDNSDTDGDLVQIGFGQGNTIAAAVIGTVHVAGGYGKNDIFFATRDVTTDTAPTERMRIQTDGNVGIGTVNPTTLLEVETNQNAVTTARVTNTNGSGGATARFQAWNGTDEARYEVLGTGYTASGVLQPHYAFLYGGTGLSVASAGPILFAPGGTTEKMRLDSNGNVGIGSTAPGATLDVNNVIRISGTAQTQMSTQGFSMLTWLTTAAAANAWVGDGDYIKRVTSLRANKFDIQPIAIDDARRTILGLHGVTYRSRVDEDKRLWAGFIADDAEKVNPVLVTYDKDGKLQSFTYDRVSAYLVPVVQELDKQVQELAKENQALKVRLEQLEKKIAASFVSLTPRNDTGGRGQGP